MQPLSPPPMARSVLDLIGNTPLLELRNIVAHLGLSGRLLAKCECFNPGYSKKDRIALEMVREALANGQLKPGQAVVELTSGNTGTGLAIACRALGHAFVAVMSKGNSIERARMMAALGAEVVLVDQVPGSSYGQVSGDDLALVEERVQELVRERDAFRCDQFRLAQNVLAHERHTGMEIWRQSGGDLDALVDFAGTGGTFTGLMRCFRDRKADVRGYLVEPAGAAVLAGEHASKPNHRIQGGGYVIKDLPLIDRSLVHAFCQVTDEQAIHAARLLARHEGILAGFSSGAHLAAAIELLRGKERGNTIVFLVCDSGLKYLSTDLFA